MASIPGQSRLPLRDLRPLLRLTSRKSPHAPPIRLFSSTSHKLVAIPFSSPSSQAKGPTLLSKTTGHHSIYISRSTNPFFNLAFERTLIQTSPPNSVILFLYINKPCVVIGRNQNPWVEANLPALHKASIPIIRRHSGGGTVFHDQGNLNWSVTCHPDVFNRDKHAEMVVRALKGLGVEGVRVNCRHDIVMDVPEESAAPATEITEAGDSAVTAGEGVEAGESVAAPTCEKAAGDQGPPGTKTYKISGSAYKLTRTRALHHGTCLLSTPEIDRIGQWLHSSLRPYIAARGVESVRSPVRNAERPTNAVMQAIVGEFRKMYGSNIRARTLGLVYEQPQYSSSPRGPQKDGLMADERAETHKWMAELRSKEWTYDQTPQFTFSTQPTETDTRERPAPPAGLEKFEASFTARNGKITEIALAGAERTGNDSPLQGKRLQDIKDWKEVFAESHTNRISHAAEDWMNELFGIGRFRDSVPTKRKRSKEKPKNDVRPGDEDPELSLKSSPWHLSARKVTPIRRIDGQEEKSGAARSFDPDTAPVGDGQTGNRAPPRRPTKFDHV